MISVSATATARAGGLAGARRRGSATTLAKRGSVALVASTRPPASLRATSRDEATKRSTTTPMAVVARRATTLIIARAGGGASTTAAPRSGASGIGGSNTGPQPIDEPPLTADSYVAVGLATCFERDDATGKLTERLVVEPISASSLECMANGARTSFRFAAGTTLGALMRGGAAGSNNPSDALPEEYRGAALCANWARRVEAAARTWQRPHAQDHLMDIAPLPAAKGGRPKARGGFNFSLDDKRVLNSVNVVTDADNVKQDISIDVYGRAEAEAAAKAEMEEEEGGAGAEGGEDGDGDAHERAEAARARATAPCEHMGRPEVADDSSDDEDELDALLAA